MLKDQWSNGLFQDAEHPAATTASNAAALGQLDVIEKFLEMTSEQLKEGLNDDE